MKKKKWEGALLNFFMPGLGLAYGENIKGAIATYIMFFVVVVGGVRFMAYTPALFMTALALIIAYYVFALISGYRAVHADKVYEKRAIDKFHIQLLVIVVHITFVSLMAGRQLDKLTPINFVKIPTPAMDPALQIGDRAAFRKTTAITRNDIVIFWFPQNIETLYIKRCIGLPGDTLKVERGVVFINNQAIQSKSPVKYRYQVTTDGSEINPRILEKFGVEKPLIMSTDVFYFFLTPDQANAFKELKFVKTVEPRLANEGQPDHVFFKNSGAWNSDFFGPIYIPKKGDRIELTEQNIDLYISCIEHENKSVQRKSQGLFIDGKLTRNYQFGGNYFFMMGDNRHNSFDSRFWGFLPEDLIVGKALYLYWSKTADRIGSELI